MQKRPAKKKNSAKNSRAKPRKRRMEGKSSQKSGKSFLAVTFGVSKAGHPELYDFLLQDCQGVFEKLGEHRISLVLERLEPLNLVYSNMDVSQKVLEKVFARFCKSHGLRPLASGYNPKHKTSCQGGLKTANLPAVMEDYNVLFDVFFCDIQLKSKKVMVDIMDPFSNSMIVQGTPANLKNFQGLLKKKLARTTFRTI